MNDYDRRALLNRVELVAGQANTALGPTMGAVRDAMPGQPGAQTYEQDRNTGHGRTVLWCWTHEREVADCQREDLMCSGESMTIGDPTGEAALEPDHASADLERHDKALAAMAKNAEILVDFYRKWRPYSSADAERVKEAFAKLMDPGDPGCELCAKVNAWSPPHVEASTAKGNLPRPYRLCRWHYSRIIESGRVPTDAETTAHLQGRKLRKSA